MVLELETKVVRFAIVSRIVVVFQLMLCGFLPQHAADIFSPPRDANATFSRADKAVMQTLSGFVNWDSRYFLFVATHGYLYQNSLVFLPLFPLLTRLLSFCLLPLGLSLAPAIVIAGILLNNCCFVLSALLLYRLGCRVFGDNTLSYKAALIFCLNPASVFFSVLYSESLFFCLSLCALLAFEKRRTIHAAALFGLCAACRSNGLLFALLLLHRSFSRCMTFMGKTSNVLVFLVSCSFLLLPTALYLILTVLPFLVTQVTAYHLYCSPLPALEQFLPHNQSLPPSLVAYGRQRGYLMPGNPPDWCGNPLPLSYSAIQATHWDVGLFRYFQLRQLPNFALVTPVTVVALVGVLAFASRYADVFKTLGLVESAFRRISDQRERMIVMRMTPYLLHLIAIFLLLALTIHVQVITRMVFSSSPCIYWILSYLLCDRVLVYEDKNEWDVFGRVHNARRRPVPLEISMEKRRARNLLVDDVLGFWRLSGSQKLVVLFLLSFFFVGIYLHGVCLPWT